MASAEKCNVAQAGLVALLDELNISDEAKDQIITLSSNVARYAAISGMEASKHIAGQTDTSRLLTLDELRSKLLQNFSTEVAKNREDKPRQAIDF
ncbi:MAG: hypothetical protein WC208_16380 [Gallionella sp.]